MYPLVQNNPNLYAQLKLNDAMIYQNNIQNYQSHANLQTVSHLQTGPVFQKLQSPHNLPNFNTQNNLLNLQNLSPIPSVSNQNSFFSYPNQQQRPVQPSPPENMSHLVNVMLNNPQVNQELQHQLNNFLISWKLQNNLQNELYKSQMSQLVEMQNRLIALKTLSSERTNSSPKTAASETQKFSPEYHTIQNQDTKPLIQPGQKKTLKNQIRVLVHFMLKNFGRVSEDQIEQEKIKYREKKREKQKKNAQTIGPNKFRG